MSRKRPSYSSASPTSSHPGSRCRDASYELTTRQPVPQAPRVDAKLPGTGRLPVSQSATATGESAADPAPDQACALHHAQRLLAIVAAMSRLAALVLPAVATLSERDGAAHPGQGVLLALTAVESVVLAAGCLRTGTVP